MWCTQARRKMPICTGPRAGPVRAFLRNEPSEEHLALMRARLMGLMAQLRRNQYPSRFMSTFMAEGIRSHNLSFHRGRARMLYDRPEKVTNQASGLFRGVHIAAELYPAIARTEREILLVSAYFVPGPRLRELLRKQVNAGVRVRLLTNSLAATDVSYVHGAYSRWRETLIRQGVEVYELRPLPKRPLPSFHLIGSSRSSLHAKALILDSRQVFIGSMNLDPRSVYLNTETGILIDCPELAVDLRASFERMMLTDMSYQVYAGDEPGQLLWSGRQEGRAVQLQRDPGAGFWRRWKAAFLGKMVPESML